LIVEKRHLINLLEQFAENSNESLGHLNRKHSILDEPNEKEMLTLE
jgi:hypothetical protein